MARKNKEPVRLRGRKMASGRTSMYLDIYIKGERRYEYLNIYLVPEKSRADKEHNRQAMQLAEAVCAKRLVEVRNREFGFRDGNQYGDITLVDYYHSHVERADLAERTLSMWKSAMGYAVDFFGENKRIDRITRHDVDAFAEYLNRCKRVIKSSRSVGDGLSQNSKVLYMSKFVALMSAAVKDGIITSNPCLSAKRFKPVQVERIHLSMEELQAMIDTPCKDDVIRRAFLFSCMTGLRASDVEKLTWGDVSEYDGMTRITFKQKKTKSLEYLDIADDAVEYMGDRAGDDKRVFSGFKYGSKMLYRLKKWAADAGVKKNVSFHTGRHTFAVMMIDLGVDLYTVSKLLGHHNIKTTQIYAKVLDRTKREAVRKIPSFKKTKEAQQ